MPKPTKEKLVMLAQEIESDQSKASPAEKRVKINAPFKKAVKKSGKRHHQKNRPSSLFSIW